MTKTLKKNIRRTISGSIGRYLSILLIILLGVGFFSGLRMTKKAMLAVEREYLRTSQLNDLRLISTLGFDDADAEALRAVDGTVAAEGSVFADFITVYGDEEYVLRAHKLLKSMNLPVLIEGRMPQKGCELVVDAEGFSPDILGKTLSLAEYNTDDTLESFRYDEYTVVGRVRSPLYFSIAKGTSSLGSGSLDGFVLIPEDGFEFEYYTELYLKTTDEYAPYSDSYDSYMDAYAARVESVSLSTVQERYVKLVADGEDEISEAEETLASETADAEAELADAEAELTDAKKKLDKADTQLKSGWRTLAANEEELKAAEKTLSDSKAKLDEGAAQMAPEAQSWDEAVETARSKVAAGQKLLDESIAAEQAKLEVSKKQLDDSEAAYSLSADELAEKKAAYDSAYALWNQSSAALKTQREQYAAGMQAYESSYAAYQKDLTDYNAEKDSLPPEEAASREAALNTRSGELASQLSALQQTDNTLTAAEAQSAESKSQLDASKALLDGGQEALDKSRAELDAFWASYNEGAVLLEASRSEQQALLDSSNAEIDAFALGAKQYREGTEALAAGKEQLQQGRQQWNRAKADYESGLRDYEDGLAEYENGVRELDEKVAEAEEKIASAKKDLAELEAPEVYVLKRSESNTGYITFSSDSDIVANVAKVFPVFFFMVAALICSTTMTRMVDDDRTQIGALRAMGYSKGRILSKYLIYSGSAALIGSVAGFFLGGYLFPFVIWTAYQMLYCIDGFICVYQWDLLAVTTAAALLCSTGTTYFALWRQMRSAPAELIRPAAPAAGKRVLLERIPFLWNRLRFMHKITVRNIFRFKKRMFMMLLGIAGCTALLLTGFGINDSIADIAEYQYNDIQVFDINVTAVDPVTESFTRSIRESSAGLQTVCKTLMSSVDVTADSGKKSAYLVASDDAAISDVIRFFLGEKTVLFPGMGEVLFSEKMAAQMNVEVGDTVTLSVSDTERGEAIVSGIVENHVYNYVYMTGETYTELFDRPFEPKNLLISLTEGADPYRVSANISSRDDVAAVSVVEDTRKMVDNMMQSLDYVVALVVASAAGLAFIVLFNLGNINISERVREIATIKVLGFHRNETGAYVFRENLILTVMGTVLGLPLGVLMHSFVMSQINVDVVSFVTQIKWQSYLCSLALVLLFAFVTDLVLRRKINRIHMAESLKSIE